MKNICEECAFQCICKHECKEKNLHDNYVSKDKIREMIKEIGTYTFDSEEEIKKFDYCIYILNELLEGE